MRAAFAGCVAACFALSFLVPKSLGDEVTYRFPKSDVVLSIPGTVQLRGRMISVSHGRFGSVFFDRDEVDYLRTRSDHDAIPKQIREAAAQRNVDALLAAGRLALKAGQPEWFRRALASLNELAPKNPKVARLTQFVTAYDAPLPPWNQDDFERETFGANPAPESFNEPRCLLYVVDAAPDAASRKLALERLALMKRTSETFFFLLAVEGVAVALPDRPLVGVWCAEAKDYQQLREKLGPKLAEATGFYASDPGVSIFFDQATGPRFAPYLSLAAALQQERKQAKAQNHPDLEEISRRADATQFVAKVVKERADVETVVHESVHQLLALSGLFPANSHPPRSLHEGIATYFEGYDGDGWAGPGALLKERHARLIKLLEEPGSYSLADVLEEGSLLGAGKLEPLDAYAYAWGACYFLAETRPVEFLRLCQSVGKESQAGKLPPERLRQLLTDTLGADAAALDEEWRTYIRNLAPQRAVPSDSP